MNSSKKILNAPELHIAIFAFLLNFFWEQLQLPLFAGFDERSYYSTVLHCTKATLGDVVISLVAFASACLVTRTRKWIVLNNISGPVTFLLIGLLITVVFEILATGPLNRWTYAETMPKVPFLEVGLSPVMQWIILPILQLWFVRRQIVGGEAIA
jgi:hypothetical protein